jgi:hypothetical protein
MAVAPSSTVCTRIPTITVRENAATISASNPSATVPFCIIAIVALQVGLGFYAIALNKLFYANYGPFYDSLAYFNALAEMSAASHAKGSLGALADQIGHSIVFYPWLVFAPFADRVPLDRSIGIRFLHHGDRRFTFASVGTHQSVCSRVESQNIEHGNVGCGHAGNSD